MKLTSPAFQDNTSLSVDATCHGRAVHPTLVIADVPQNAQSLALVMHDPDGVSGDFTHWLVWNMPATTTTIPEGQLDAQALQGTNDYPTQTYGPACPPPGTGLHHYIFVLYALDSSLELPPGTNRKTLEAAIQGHVLAQAQLTGTVQA
jgi:Raf kinase inhibitor-like YbhB/YbcL family protein